MSNVGRWVAIILTCALLSPLPAQRDVTGTQWQSWKADRRMGYLIGFYAGLKSDYAGFQTAERGQNLAQPGMTNPMVTARYKMERSEYYSRTIKYDFKLLARMMDAFYADPDNLAIPLPETIRILRLRDAGKTERADFLLLRERRKSLGGR